MIMIVEHIDPESAQIREVSARFGLAMYRAQCLERQLAIIMATKYGPGPTRITREEFDALQEGLFRRTLGQLVSEIGKLVEVNEDEKEQLKDALKKRNWLVHHYFWDRAVMFQSESGRASMISELQEIAEYFQALDEIYTNRTRVWGETVGITQLSIDEDKERLLRGCTDYIRVSQPRK